MAIEPEALNMLISFEQGVDGAPQVAYSLAVDDPKPANSLGEAGVDVSRNQLANISRREFVKIKHTVDRVLMNWF